MPDNLDLNSRRESVITKTPTDTPLVTPSGSPVRSQNSEEESFHSDSEASVFSNASNSRIVKMEAEEINTALKVAEVDDAIIGFPVSDFTEYRVPFFEREISSFESVYKEAIKQINSLCLVHKDDLSQERVDHWTEQKSQVHQKAKDYKKAMYAKLHELSNQNRVAAVNEGEGINDFHTQSLELKKQELQIREKALAVKEKENADKASELLKQAAEKKAAAICKAKLKFTAIFADCELLAGKVDVEFLGDYSNMEISRMMIEVEKW